MDQHALLQRCRQLSGAKGEAEWTADDAIGFFQSLRPQGTGLRELFDQVPHGDELRERLARVFAVSGDPTRSDGMRDAYFIVRRPTAISPEVVQQAARCWLENLRRLDQRIGSGTLADLLTPLPRIRVLQGKPPKHPRDPAERSRLLTEISSFPDRFIDPLRPEGDSALGLRRAYYFIACDAYLRDHLLWPLYRHLTGFADPLEPYFTLWEHGAKFRIFNDEEFDLYVPRTDL